MRLIALSIFLLFTSVHRASTSYLPKNHPATQKKANGHASNKPPTKSPHKAPPSTSTTSTDVWLPLGPSTSSPKKAAPEAEKASSSVPSSPCNWPHVKPSAPTSPLVSQSMGVGIANLTPVRPSPNVTTKKELNVPVMSRSELQTVLDYSKFYKYFEKLSFDGPYATAYAGVETEVMDDVDMTDLDTDLENVLSETFVKQMVMKKWFLDLNSGKRLRKDQKSTQIKATVIGVHFWSITGCWPFLLYQDTEAAIHEVQSYFDSPQLPALLQPNYLYDDSTDFPQLFKMATGLKHEKDLQFLRALWTFSRATGIILDVKTANGAVTSTDGTPSHSRPWVNNTRPFDMFMNIDLISETTDMVKTGNFELSVSNFVSDCKEVMSALYAKNTSAYYLIYKTRFEACTKNNIPFVFPLIIFTSSHSSCALMLPNETLWTLGNSGVCLAEEYRQKTRGLLSEPDFIEMTSSLNNTASSGFKKNFDIVKWLDIVDLPQKAPNCMHKTFFDLFRLFSRYHERVDVYDLFVKSAIQNCYQRLVTAASEKISLNADLPRVVTKAAFSSADIYESLKGPMLEFWKNGELSHSALLEGIVESEIVRHIRLGELERLRKLAKEVAVESSLPKTSHLDAPKYLRECINLVDPGSLTAAQKIMYLFVSFTIDFEARISTEEIFNLLQDESVSRWKSEYVYEDIRRFNLFELAGLFKIPLKNEELIAIFSALYPTKSSILAHFPQFVPFVENSFISKALTALKNPFDAHATTECLRSLDEAMDEVFAECGGSILPVDLRSDECFRRFRVIFEHRNQNFGDLGIVYDLASLVWTRLALPHLLLSKYRQIQAENPSQLRLPLLAESNKVLISPDEVVPMAPANYEDLHSICSKLSFILATDADSMNAKLWADLGTHTQIMESYDAKNPENMMIPDGADAIGTSFADLYAYLGEYSTD